MSGSPSKDWLWGSCAGMPQARQQPGTALSSGHKTLTQKQPDPEGGERDFASLYQLLPSLPELHLTPAPSQSAREVLHLPSALSREDELWFDASTERWVAVVACSGREVLRANGKTALLALLQRDYARMQQGASPPCPAAPVTDAACAGDSDASSGVGEPTALSHSSLVSVQGVASSWGRQGGLAEPGSVHWSASNPVEQAPDTPWALPHFPELAAAFLHASVVPVVGMHAVLPNWAPWSRVEWAGPEPSTVAWVVPFHAARWQAQLAELESTIHAWWASHGMDLSSHSFAAAFKGYVSVFLTRPGPNPTCALPKRKRTRTADPQLPPTSAKRPTPPQLDEDTHTEARAPPTRPCLSAEEAASELAALPQAAQRFVRYDASSREWVAKARTPMGRLELRAASAFMAALTRDYVRAVELNLQPHVSPRHQKHWLVLSTPELAAAFVSVEYPTNPMSVRLKITWKGPTPDEMGAQGEDLRTGARVTGRNWRAVVAKATQRKAEFEDMLLLQPAHGGSSDDETSSLASVTDPRLAVAHPLLADVDLEWRTLADGSIASTEGAAAFVLATLHEAT